MATACEELALLLERRFRFMTERGYRVVGENANGGDGCLIVLEGNSIRLKFYTARDEPLNILVGDNEAPPGWAEEIDGERVWHHLATIAGFLDGDTDIGARVALMSSEEWLEQRRGVHARLAGMLEAHLQQIEDLFGTGEFARRRHAYEDYILRTNEKTRAAVETRSRS